MTSVRQLKRIGPVADAYIRSRAFIQGIMGPVGSGKTIASSQKMLLLAARQKGVVNDDGVIVRKSRFAFIRDTYPNLDRNTIPSWWKIVPKEMGEFIGSSPRIHRFSMILAKDRETGRPTDIAQVEVEFRAIGNDSVEDALRGLEVTAAFVNEADRTAPDILTYLAGRVGRFGDLDPTLVVDPCILLDLNGNDDENWTYKVLVAEALDPATKEALALISGGRPLVEYFEQPEAIDENGKVNPKAENIHNLPPGYYERQYALAKMRGDQNYIDRMLRSKFVPLRNGMVVFPEYIDKLHSSEFEAISGLPLVVWADQGLLGAVLIAQPVKGQLRVLEEISNVFESANDQIVVQRMGGEALGQITRQLLNLKYAEYELADAVCDPAGAAGEGAINFKSWRQDFQKGLGHRVRKAKVPRNAIAPQAQGGAPADQHADRRTARADDPQTLQHAAPRLHDKILLRARRRIERRRHLHRNVPVKVQGYGDLMDACQYGCFEFDRKPDLSAGRPPTDRITPPRARGRWGFRCFEREYVTMAFVSEKPQNTRSADCSAVRCWASCSAAARKKRPVQCPAASDA